jgi:diguanylate cyclase (GGDEF)-like protein/PAS domain S-box-containing protein
MSPLAVGNLLDPCVIRVQSERRYRDVACCGKAGRVFAVFEESEYLGIVTEKQAALFPGRIFADLLVLTQPDPIEKDADIDQVLSRIQAAKDGFLPVVDRDGSFQGIVSELSLFTALSRLERRLRKEKEQLITQLEAEVAHHRIAAAVFDHTSEGILVTDANAIVTLANEAFSRKTGFTLSELIGRRPGILSSAHHDRKFLRAMQSSLSKTGTWSGQVWNRRKDGEAYPEWLHVNTVFDETGEITDYVGIFSDISNQRHIQRNLHQLAYYDTLTGLPNRLLFHDRISQAIKCAQRGRTEFALLFVDLDRFKDVNDSLGHGFGDKLLQAAALRLKQALRECDTVARLGGDEFTVLLQGEMTERDAIATATRISEVFNGPLEVEDRRIFVTASIGIAHYPEDGSDPDSLMKNADAAMYRAKEEGRNRFCVFRTQLNVEVSERLDMENALRASLEEGSLSIVWQPLVHLGDGGIMGFEALARWHHPDLGDVPPVQFIPLAERAGLMRLFGTWVLKAVADEIAQLGKIWNSYPLSFAVNFSAVQIYDDDTLRNNIRDTLDSIGLKPEHFILEVTESTFMKSGRSTEAVLGELTALGLQIAVDDFGTGYSNLAYLKRFAVNHLKVDQSFVRDVVEDPATRQIITAIVQMAHSLNIQVIAEGVETEEQKNILLDLGCDEGQGYLFGRPMELSQVFALDFGPAMNAV